MPHYTLKEMIDLMEPQAVRDKSLIVRCIGGLTQYAAELRQRAIPNEQTRIPILRELVSEMAAYWNLEEFSDGGTPEAYQKDFDSRVAGAERAGEPLATTHEQKTDAIFGLYRYAMDMIPSLGADGVQAVTVCKDLIHTLAREWAFDLPRLNTMCGNIETSLREQAECERKLGMGGLQ